MKHRLIQILTAFLLLIGGFANAADNDELTLLVFGDSLSAAYGIDEEAGWVTLLANKLAAENWPVTVVNGSVSGETTTGGLARLPAMLDSYKPDLVILELGGNDGLRGLPIAIMRENLETMVDLILATNAEVLLAGIQIPPNYGPRYTEPFFAQFGELAAARDLALVPFLIDGIPQQPELMQRDGIHPKAEAQSMIVDNVWPELAPLLEALVNGE
jgi:acyl-CoA thioesterase-1